MGLFRFDLVAKLLGGPASPLSRAVYSLVGVAGGYIEAAQAVRRGDLTSHARPQPRGGDTAADRARTAALIFLFTARDLRRPGHAPAVC